MAKGNDAAVDAKAAWNIEISKELVNRVNSEYEYTLYPIENAKFRRPKSTWNMVMLQLPKPIIGINDDETYSIPIMCSALDRIRSGDGEFESIDDLILRNTFRKDRSLSDIYSTYKARVKARKALTVKMINASVSFDNQVSDVELGKACYGLEMKLLLENSNFNLLVTKGVRDDGSPFMVANIVDLELDPESALSFIYEFDVL